MTEAAEQMKDRQRHGGNILGMDACRFAVDRDRLFDAAAKQRLDQTKLCKFFDDFAIRRRETT